MRIVDGLRSEHRLIERVAGSLVTLAHSGAPREELGGALGDVCTFLEGYVDGYHHAKEEDLLLPALLAEQLPEAGPVAALRGEHAEHRAVATALRAMARACGAREPVESALQVLATRYCARLWEHIDKEDSVLFPEVETRLALQAGRLNAALDAFEARSEDLASLAALGASLVERFPPRTELPGVMRGEGCVMCRHYGDTCQGIEREWWTELEWETFWARPT